jgi:hypothetical protein
MKTRLYCRIFGHKFLGLKKNVDVSQSSTTTSIIEYPINYCANCGLTKEDLGIKKEVG